MPKTRIIYFSPQSTSPWLVSKYAEAIRCGGADVQIYTRRSDLSGYSTGIIPTKASVHQFPSQRYLPFVWRHSVFNKLRISLPSFSIIKALLDTKADIYIAGDPDDLVLAVSASQITGARVAYIPFEYYPGLSYGGHELSKRNRWIEATFKNHVYSWVSLGDKLSELYSQELEIPDRLHTVYSSLPRQKSLKKGYLRELLGLSPEHIIVLYTGQITKTRGLWDVLPALRHLNSKIVFVVVGPMDVELLRSDVAHSGLSDRVFVLNKVPQNFLMKLTADADIGLIPIPDICTSYKYCNPGKLFEYLAAGLPLITTDLAQLGWYVKTRGLGETFAPGNVTQLQSALSRMGEDDDYRYSCAAATAHTQDVEACWEIQAEKLRAAILN